MDGVELYAIWQESLNNQGLGVDDFEDLDEADKRAWNEIGRLAKHLPSNEAISLAPLDKQAAILSSNPGLFEACVVLESDPNGARPILYQGSMEVAERVMSCWNVQLGVATKNINKGVAP